MTEGKRMGRNVDFGNDLDKTFCGFLLKMDEFFFSIVTIAGCIGLVCVKSRERRSRDFSDYCLSKANDERKRILYDGFRTH